LSQKTFLRRLLIIGQIIFDPDTIIDSTFRDEFFAPFYFTQSQRSEPFFDLAGIIRSEVFLDAD